MELKAAILDLGNKFWPLLPQFIRLMTPLRLAILTLQGDHAKLSDVMGAWIRIHASQMDLLADETCTFQAQTSSHADKEHLRGALQVPLPSCALGGICT